MTLPQTVFLKKAQQAGASGTDRGGLFKFPTFFYSTTERETLFVISKMLMENLVIVSWESKRQKSPPGREKTIGKKGQWDKKKIIQRLRIHHVSQIFI